MILPKLLNLKKSSVKETVDNRLEEFRSFKDKPSGEWFSELCFCILTANSKAITALSIQAELGEKGFCGYCQRDLSNAIKRHKHRFHNNKAGYIVAARCHLDIRQKVVELVADVGEIGAREWLVKNIKGLGFKEASHFLRNVGYTSLAILDRHIISSMLEHNIIAEKPKAMTRRNYLAIEDKFRQIAESAEMSCAELDLYMWFMKTGKVLK